MKLQKGGIDVQINRQPTQGPALPLQSDVFTAVYGFGYRPKLTQPYLLLRGNEAPPRKDLAVAQPKTIPPMLKVLDVGETTYVVQRKIVEPKIVELLKSSLFWVIPTTKGLLVCIDGIQLTTSSLPIAVSFGMEHQPHDKDEKRMLVLEYGFGTVLDKNFESEAFRNRFPMFDQFSERKITREDSKGFRLLMITEDVNTPEMAADRLKIKQVCIIAHHSRGLRRWNSALSG
ncbi:MAG: hypothetical protein M1504_00005, partial [Candidatus Marsarchaeota archaeon]|nr:hypothetical protein [Candidatus Marsarchaeota archaeon]